MREQGFIPPEETIRKEKREEKPEKSMLTDIMENL
jgi:hypothetical protein